MLVIGLFALLSCEKDETKTTLSATTGAPVLTVPGGSSMVLQEANKDQTLTYTWTASDYGAQVIVNYTLQIDKQGNHFSDPINLGTVNATLKFTISVGDLNSKLLPLLFDPKVPEALAMEYRLISNLKDNNGASIDTAILKPVFSGLKAQSITPYYVPIVYPLLNVPGNYQGWNPADSTTTIASVKSNDKYEGYMWFPAATEFKYAKGSWDNNWGDNNADGSLEKDGANIAAAEEGYYKLNVDLVGLTHTFVKTSWGVIGSATPTGWDSDTDMSYDQATKVWTVTMNLTAAEIKFRANNAWDINYGDDGGNGTLEAGGANIVVPSAGNYTITLNLSNPVYKYKLQKN